MVRLRYEHKQHHIEVCIYPSIPSLCMTLQKFHNVRSPHEDLLTNHSKILHIVNIFFERLAGFEESTYESNEHYWFNLQKHIFICYEIFSLGKFHCHFKVIDLFEMCFVEHYLFYLALCVLVIHSLHRILMFYHRTYLFLKKINYFEWLWMCTLIHSVHKKSAKSL